MQDKLTEDIQKAIDNHFAYLDRIRQSLEENLKSVGRSVSAELARRRRQEKVGRILGDETAGESPEA